jgi:hypothetical protein
MAAPQVCYAKNLAASVTANRLNLSREYLKNRIQTGHF